MLTLLFTVVLYVSASGDSVLCPHACDCGNGTVVNCSGNNIQTFIKTKDQFGEKVKILDISDNKFITINNDFFTWFKLLGLLELNCSGNSISEIQEHAFYGMSDLLKLDLARNNISQITEKLFSNCLKLSHLFLSENNIFNISSSVFTGLVNLVELDLSHNKIESVMYGSFDDLVNLRILQLSNNYIAYISEGLFENQNNMAFLDISNNNMTTISSSLFAGCSYLKNLSLSRNNISKIKENAFFGLSMLTFLDLSENAIINIEVDALNFSNSTLKMQETLNSPSTEEIHLEYLNLSKNQLNEFSLELHFPELANGTLFVDLSYNRLMKLDSDSVTWLVAHHSVSLDYTGNPWDCTCDNSEMRIAYTSLKDRLSLNCTTPESVKGRLWKVLKDCDLTTVSSGSVGVMFATSSGGISTVDDFENISTAETSSVTEVTNETEAKERLFVGSFFLRPDVLVNVVYACLVFVATIIITIRNYRIHRPEDEFWWEDKLAKRSY